MKPTPHKPTAPRARVMYVCRAFHADSKQTLFATNRSRWHDSMDALAVIPCRTAKQARAFVRFWNLKEEERVEAVARALYMDDTGPVKGRAARFELCQQEQGIESYYIERKAKAVLAAIYGGGK